MAAGKKTEGQVRILLETHEDDPGIGEVDYAVVVLTESDIRLILKHMEEIKSRDDVNYLSAFDYSPVWVNSDERLLYRTIFGDEASDVTGMELEIREVSDRYVQWTAVYKHCNVKIETEVVYRETLLKLLEVAEGKKTMDQLDLDEAETTKLNITMLAELKEQFAPDQPN